MGDDTQAAGERTAALVKALGRLGMQEWGDSPPMIKGPTPLTAERIDALLGLWPMAVAPPRLSE
jgi:hypothetical protein